MLVTQSCSTLCDPMNCSLPGSSVQGIFQARILAWVAMSLSRGTSWPKDQTWDSYIAGSLLHCKWILLPTKPPRQLLCLSYPEITPSPPSSLKKIACTKPVPGTKKIRNRCCKGCLWLYWAPLDNPEYSLYFKLIWLGTLISSPPLLLVVM